MLGGGGALPVAVPDRHGWSQRGRGLYLGRVGSVQSFTVHGHVPAQTTPPPGNYFDTVVVAITY
ncbi:spore coat protein U domain-containing protein (plasmid) [Paracoccus seriniphilus]|nr:spore coat protein U domain-containing protein [Paracoccus seriniphilus]